MHVGRRVPGRPSHEAVADEPVDQEGHDRDPADDRAEQDRPGLQAILGEAAAAGVDRRPFAVLRDSAPELDPGPRPDERVELGNAIVAREIVADEPRQLRSLLVALSNRPEIDALLVTGGTGISRRDRTYETVAELLDKPIPGYGELFRWLSFEEIGAAAMLSRTIGGLVGQTVLLTMPGSPHAVRLALEKLILPELGHLVREARR